MRFRYQYYLEKREGDKIPSEGVLRKEIQSRLSERISNLVEVKTESPIPDKRKPGYERFLLEGTVYAFAPEIMEDVIRQLESISTCTDDSLSSKQIQDVIDELKRN